LVHAIDAVVVFLKTRDLSTKKSNFTLQVFSSNSKIIAFIDELSVLILVSLEMSLLVFDITSQGGAFAVPEVDFVSILSS